MRSRTILVSAALLSIQLLAARAALTTASRGPECPLSMKESARPNQHQPDSPLQLQPKAFSISFDTRDSFDDKFEVGPRLAEGGQGVVRLVTDRKTSQRLAVKKVPVDSDNRDQVKEEIRILKLLMGQTHILQFHSVYKDKTKHKFLLVTELIEGCSLDRFSYLSPRRSSRKDINASFIPAIVRQLLQALAYLHGQGLVHNDVKPGNVMLGKRGGVKLIDFGYCQVHDPKNETILGTAYYVSPEKYDATISPAADVWALGVTIFSLHSDPYLPDGSTLGMVAFGRKIIKYGCPWPAQAGEEDPWDRLPDEAREFCEQCLRMNHHDRAKMAELADTDFIKNSCSDESLDAYIQTL